MDYAVSVDAIGDPNHLVKGSRPVAQVIYRDGTLLDTIYNVN